jgi:putative endonuclease
MTKKKKQFSVYIMTNNNNTVLYTGVTNDLKRRVYEPKQDIAQGFTKKYRVHKLVYYQVVDDAYGAISREKQIKGGSREDKLKLIRAFNSEWQDSYDML